MFGLFRKTPPAAPLPRKELASPQPNGFTAEEIATINGSYLLVRAAAYDLGGEVPSRWNESFSAFEERAPDLTLAQAWMIRAFYNGLEASPFVSTDEESKLADRIGRTYLRAFPEALDSIVGRSCRAAQGAFFAFLERLDDED
ncbi:MULTISPECIES: hypothetical protein [Brevundimonas]|uniref:hypothetical protein n=1 Tax=Brevundimonas sp. UBA7507 TaxID=1946137 RepID=UPI00257FE398|nr:MULTISPECIES: hypothetical protein [Brevundimonas]